MSSSPSGTVTFLLADVEGSSGLQSDERVDYPVVLGRIRSILRQAVDANAGHEVDAVGDELLAAFSDADRAVTAAYDAQRAMRDADWPEFLHARIRIGLHTGTPSIGVEGYTGIDLVRVSRIANAGHGGQILASAATVEAVEDVTVRDLGEQRLERLPEPEHLFQLLADDLAQDFPPLRNTSATVGKSIRVVLADDSVLLREGVALLLSESGFDVLAQSGDAEDLLRHVGMHKPDVAVVDIRMPPTYTDEGLRAARTIRERYPDTGVLVLSQYVESGYALDLLSESAEGVGYLLKDRVSDVEQFAESVRRVAEGGSALDPAVVSQLIGRQRVDDPLDELTPREREILALMAEGHSNDGICGLLFLSPKTVEGHIHHIFLKLELGDLPAYNRRVLAVLKFLRPG